MNINNFLKPNYISTAEGQTDSMKSPIAFEIVTNSYSNQLSETPKVKESLQEAFLQFRKKRQEDIQQERRQRETVREDSADVARLDVLRAKLITQARKYFGVPYAKKYWDPSTPEYKCPLFLDCCGLVRQVIRDLQEDLGFRLGPWNQAYMFDTLPVTLTKEQMKAGDLVFMTGIYVNPKSKKQRHDMLHVEIWLGEGDQTIGSRWNNGKVSVFESYEFSPKSFHSEQYIFKSIETWLMGICQSFCPEHPWRVTKYICNTKSIFSVDDAKEEERDFGNDADNQEAQADEGNKDRPTLKTERDGTQIPNLVSRQTTEPRSSKSCISTSISKIRSQTKRDMDKLRGTARSLINRKQADAWFLQRADRLTCRAQRILHCSKTRHIIIKGKIAKNRMRQKYLFRWRTVKNHVLMRSEDKRNRCADKEFCPEAIHRPPVWEGWCLRSLLDQVYTVSRGHSRNSYPESRIWKVIQSQLACIKDEDNLTCVSGVHSQANMPGSCNTKAAKGEYAGASVFGEKQVISLPENKDSMLLERTITPKDGTDLALSGMSSDMDAASIDEVVVELVSLSYSRDSAAVGVGKVDNMLRAINTSFTSDLCLSNCAFLEDRWSLLNHFTVKGTSVASVDPCFDESLKNHTDGELHLAMEMAPFSGHSASAGAVERQYMSPTWDRSSAVSTGSQALENLNNNSSKDVDGSEWINEAWITSSPSDLQRNNTLPPLGPYAAKARLTCDNLKKKMTLMQNIPVLPSSCWSQEKVDALDDSVQVTRPTCEEQTLVTLPASSQEALQGTENSTELIALPHQSKRDDHAVGHSRMLPRSAFSWSGFDVSTSALNNGKCPPAGAEKGDESEETEESAELDSCRYLGKTCKDVKSSRDKPEQCFSTPTCRKYFVRNFAYPSTNSHGCCRKLKKLEVGDIAYQIQSSDAPCQPSRTHVSSVHDEDEDEEDNADDSNDNDDDEDYCAAAQEEYTREEDKAPADSFKFCPRAIRFATKMVPDFLKVEDDTNDNDQFDDDDYVTKKVLASHGCTSLLSPSLCSRISARNVTPPSQSGKSTPAGENSTGTEARSAGGAWRKIPATGVGGGDDLQKSSGHSEGGGGDSPGRERGGTKKGGRPSRLPQCCLPSNMQPTFYIGGGNGIALIESPLLALGWKRTVDKNDEKFKLKWVENKSRINYLTFREGEQLVNHIPNCKLLTNKLGLLCSLQEYERVTLLTKGRLPRMKMADFVPETYKLDEKVDRGKFLNEYKDGETWICKPTGMNQGKGIFLLRSREEITQLLSEREARFQSKITCRIPMMRIVQRYIHNPLLLDGRKFDIRSYMFIASTVPYLVLYHKGYVRLSCQKYKQEDPCLTTHLTNQFVQKKDPMYKEVKEDTAWSMSKLNDYINEHVAKEKGLEPDWVFGALTKQMQRITLHCFNSVKHKLQCKIGYFDLYGLDFMVDSEMKVWLIEINANPALHTNCSALKEAIPSVVESALYLAIECFDKSRKGQSILPLNSLGGYTVLYCGSSPNCSVPRQIRSVSPFKDVMEWIKPAGATPQARRCSPPGSLPRMSVSQTSISHPVGQVTSALQVVNTKLDKRTLASNVLPTITIGASAGPKSLALTSSSKQQTQRQQQVSHVSNCDSTKIEEQTLHLTPAEAADVRHTRDKPHRGN